MPVHNHLTLGKVLLDYYLCLPMGLACSLDIYQEKMSELFIDMISIIVYQDEIFVLTSGSFDDHLRQLGNVFK